MIQKIFFFRCAYCAGDTRFSINVPDDPDPAETKRIRITEYCEHCQRANAISVPETWSQNPLVLGDDEIIDKISGVPVLQGFKQ